MCPGTSRAQTSRQSTVAYTRPVTATVTSRFRGRPTRTQRAAARARDLDARTWAVLLNSHGRGCA